jgi:hypothetical protein
VAYQPLNGPALYGNISVTTTPVEVKVGGSRFSDRAAITIQPIDGNIYIGYDNAVSTTTGTLIYKGQVFILECGPLFEVWIRSATGTVDTRIAELG